MACCWTNLRTQEPTYADNVVRESAVAGCMAIMVMYVNEQADEEMVSSQEKENSIPKWSS